MEGADEVGQKMRGDDAKHITLGGKGSLLHGAYCLSCPYFSQCPFHLPKLCLLLWRMGLLSAVPYLPRVRTPCGFDDRARPLRNAWALGPFTGVTCSGSGPGAWGRLATAARIVSAHHPYPLFHGKTLHCSFFSLLIKMTVRVYSSPDS